MLLGFSAWLLPEPVPAPSLVFLVWVALSEEIVFRLLLQGGLQRLLQGAYLLTWLSLANVLTSIIFAAMHLLHQPTLWALAVFFPSLVFGWAMDRYQSVLAPVLLHFFYNSLLFYRL